MSYENAGGKEARRLLGGVGGLTLQSFFSHALALPGITGILMSAAGLPVCLTRPPKLALHPPPVSKSEIKSIPGVSNTSRKTTKKQAKKGIGLFIERGPGGEVTDMAPSPGSASTTEGHTHAFPLCALISASAKWAYLVPVLMITSKGMRYGSDGDTLRNIKMQRKNIGT